MRIIVVTPESVKYEFQVSPYDKLQILKEKLLKEGYKGEYSGLIVLDDNFLEEGVTFAQNNVQQGSELLMSNLSQHYYNYENGSGLTASFNFNDLSTKIEKGFSNKAPIYRTIRPGLNMEGTCKNQGCDAKNKKVWVSKSFVQNFMINMEIYQLPCPMCGEMVEQAVNFGFYKTKFSIKGLRFQGKKQIKIDDQLQANKNDSFITFVDGKQKNQVPWQYLVVTAKKL